jgi:dethiobiotin synthetase
MANRPQVLVITGTGTGVGKTTLSQQWLNQKNAEGLRTLGLKPIASGAVRESTGRLVNDDALLLQACSSIAAPYESINPFVFEPPIAPHIAANQAGISMRASTLAAQVFQTIDTYRPDLTLIEGAGGFLLPLNDSETFPDFLAELSLHVDLQLVLVVGMKLGCLNHALLSLRAIDTFIQQNNARFLGFFPNSLGEKMPYFEENVETLARYSKTFNLDQTPKEFPNVPSLEKTRNLPHARA